LPDFELDLERHAAGVLAPGEHLLAAVRAMPIGPFGGSLGIFAGAAVGAIVQSVAISRSVKRALLSGFPLAGRMAIGITERRILVWNRGGLMGGQITKLLGEVPVTRLSGITIEPVPGRTKLTFSLRDAQEVTVEADRRDRPERFTEVTRRYNSGDVAASPAPVPPPPPPPIPPPPPLSDRGGRPVGAAVMAPTALSEEDERNCAKCQTRNPARAEFCWRCFTPFPRPSRPFSGAAGPRPLGGSLVAAGLSPSAGLSWTPAPPPRWLRGMPSSEGAGWPVAAKAGLAALIVVLTAGAVFVAFGRTQHSRIAIPGSIAGAQRIITPQTRQAESQIAGLARRQGTSGKAGFFGVGGTPTFAVVGFDYSLSEHESPEVVFQQFSNGMASAHGNSSIDMATLTNDRLGGATYLCAQLRGELPGSVCMWSETDVVGFVLAIRQGVTDARALTTTVRNAVEG
jgi:ribosomal protein L40E